MAKKGENPLLAAYKARLEADYASRLNFNSEIDLMAHLLSCDDDLQVDFDEAEKVLNGFLESKMDVVQAVIQDTDKELVYTRYDLARRLKQILGPDNWKKYCKHFALLSEYWEV